MQVDILASTVTDNFFYLLWSGDQGVLVDPVDAPVALEAVARRGITSLRILVTHGHPDHVAGNDAVVAATGAIVMAPAKAERWPVAHDIGMEEGDEVWVGDETLQILHMPGHTDDHLVAVGSEVLVGGDLLFFCGVGHTKAGGDRRQLFDSLQRLAELPASLRVLPGHDYGARNVAFGLDLWPQDAALQAVQKRTGAQAPRTLLHHTLAQERKANPFLRLGEPTIASALRRHPRWEDHGDEAFSAFMLLRTLRDEA
jgi:hydroxyacylglutathione hydrolase